MTNHATEIFSTMHRRFRIADRAPLRNFHPKNKLSGSLVQGLDEGDCGEVTNRGEEACECAVKLTHKRRRQPHSRQSCEVTDRNSIQGRCGQVSEPNLTKPSSFIRIGKSRACAAKAIRLILGDPSHESARSACRTDRATTGNGAGVWRKSAEVIVLFRRIPATTGRTEP